MNPTLCGLPCLPAVTNVPGPTGPSGTNGTNGTDGTNGTNGTNGTSWVSSTIATYGSGTFTFTSFGSLNALALHPTPPSVVLPGAGTYLLFARVKFNGAGGCTFSSGQTLTTQIHSITNLTAVPNTTRVFAPVCTTLTGTLAEITFPVVAYIATGSDVLALYASLSAASDAGTVTCTEADIIAVQIA